MRKYTECYIAFIDLLGFKKLVKNKDCETIACFFDEIQRECFVTIDETKSDLMDYNKLNVKIMSDTICMYVESNVQNALPGLIAVCNYFQARMLRLEEPVLTRGAIVKDKIYAHKDITFGPGVSKAYLLEENVAKYPRIILTKSLLENCDKCDSWGKDYLNKFTHLDYDKFCTIDYLYLFYGLSQYNNDWEKFMQYIYFMLDNETDVSIREKYLYLNNNIERVKKKHLRLN